jgi:hypothetical protein
VKRIQHIEVKVKAFDFLTKTTAMAILMPLLVGMTACSRSELPVSEAQQVQPQQPSQPELEKPAKMQEEFLPWYIRSFMEDSGWQLEAEFVAPEFGMYELTQFPDKEPTAEQQRNAQELLEKTFAAVKARGWLNKEQALKDGYQNMYQDKIHYYKEEFLYDDEVLNPERPEFLMFYPTQHGELLMGVMFGSVERGPQIGGPLTLWHYHIEKGICYRNGHLPIGEVNEKGECAEGVTSKHSPEMLHMWFFDHPDGRFATRMRLSEEHFKLAEEQVWKLYGETR